MSRVLKCLKCEAEMIQGFIPESSHSGKLVSSWVEGKPKESFWSRTKVPILGHVPIGAFRCKCVGSSSCMQTGSLLPSDLEAKDIVTREK